MPGAAAGIAALNTAGIRVVLVTNKRLAARPGADVAAYAAVQARFDQLLENGEGLGSMPPTTARTPSVPAIAENRRRACWCRRRGTTGSMSAPP